MTHSNARKESIGSLLGRNTDEAVTEEMPYQGISQSRTPLSRGGKKNSTLQMLEEGDEDEEKKEKEEEKFIERSRMMSAVFDAEKDKEKTEKDRKIKLLFGSKAGETMKTSLHIEKPPEEAVPHLSRRPKSPQTPTSPVKSKLITPEGPPELIAAQKLLHVKVTQYFQKHFSKHIRVTDIPRGDDLNRVDPRTLRENLKRQIEGEHRECILMETYDYDIEDTVVYGDTISTDDLEDIGAVVGSDDHERSCSLEDVASVQTAIGKIPFTPAAGISFSSAPHGSPDNLYEIKRKNLESIRLQMKVKILEELDDQPKIKEPLGTPMHSDKELLKIFSEDSKLHDEKMVGIKVEDKEDKDIKGWRRRDRQSRALVALMDEIDAAEDHNDVGDSFNIYSVKRMYEGNI
eukprot:CAMPEP_0119051728 /NCGR_PEP_ID=MMETSP1177-20130426/73256_1 /TAXON_ID=2985 /ORGANISM="Ochromonas sp, Strain CCMP1899" /LENGTH=402 /DNA_ID=CAMNT_0007031043 /DNA_START=954 /DNA_END=2162 /DNA_ORIENTATION=-